MIYILTASLVFILDRVTKAIVLNNMVRGQSIEVLPNIFHITFVLNDGTAFGLLKGNNTLFIAISLLVMASVAIYLLHVKPQSRMVILAGGLILGGAFATWWIELNSPRW